MNDYQPRSKNQLAAYQSIDSNTFTFLIGPPGCGKSFISLFKAVQYYQSGKISKIVIIRPCIEANFGEKLGSLPGTANEKIAVHLGAIYDNIKYFLQPCDVENMINKGQIELVPLSFIRGRSFNSSYIIVEEAQNVSAGGIFTILTRVGLNCKMVINGDPNQCDVKYSDFMNSITKIQTPHLLKDFGIVEFNAREDIIRNPNISHIIKRFQNHG